MLGRIADTLTDPSLLGYKFLIVGHTASTGRRDNNLTLSQRRADVIREVLVNTFKISPKRLQAIGLGEEQLLDAVHPAAPINQSTQVATVGALDLNPPPSPSLRNQRPLRKREPIAISVSCCTLPLDGSRAKRRPDHLLSQGRSMGIALQPSLMRAFVCGAVASISGQ